MEKADHYLLEHGLTPSDLPKAVLVHEGLGIGLLAGVLAACYGVQPTKRFVAAYDRDLMIRMMIRADALVNKFPVFVTARTDPQRLLVRVWSRRASLGVGPPAWQVSVAESLLVRNALRPLTIPLKLWVTWQIVRSTK